MVVGGRRRSADSKQSGIMKDHPDRSCLERESVAAFVLLSFNNNIAIIYDTGGEGCVHYSSSFKFQVLAKETLLILK